MALIIGTEYCKVDTNGRFKFPIALKRQLETEDNRFVVRQSVNAECLELWPYPSFQAEVEELQKRLNLYNIEDNKIMRQLTRANVVELDSSDRMLLPPERKGVLGDAKEIVLQSTGRCIEIWGRSAYDNMNIEASLLANIVNERLGQGGALPYAQRSLAEGDKGQGGALPYAQRGRGEGDEGQGGTLPYAKGSRAEMKNGFNDDRSANDHGVPPAGNAQ